MEGDFIIHHPANESLKAFVDYFFHINIPVSELKFNEEFIFPFPRITFGYFFQHPFEVRNHTNGKHAQAELIFSRVSTDQVSVRPVTDHIKIVGAHIKPYALALLSQNPVSDLPWLVQAEDLWEDFDPGLKDSLQQCSEPEEMFMILEQFFLDHILLRNLELITGAIDLIELNKGDISITELSDKLCVSVRTLRNHFYRSVGCSPKDYLLLVKLRQSIYQMKYSEDSLTSVSYQQHFADQAHFTHTMKNLLGSPPKLIRQKIPHFRFLQF